MTQLGCYREFITNKEQKKILVRRSRRIADGKTSHSLPEINEEVPTREPVDVIKDEVGDLCSIFQSTFAISNGKLKVEHKEIKRVSPMPKLGRYTSLTGFSPAPKSFSAPKGQSEIMFISPVKRSTRNELTAKSKQDTPIPKMGRLSR